MLEKLRQELQGGLPKVSMPQTLDSDLQRSMGRLARTGADGTVKRRREEGCANCACRRGSWARALKQSSSTRQAVWLVVTVLNLTEATKRSLSQRRLRKNLPLSEPGNAGFLAAVGRAGAAVLPQETILLMGRLKDLEVGLPR
jgi:hypothetical protein